MPKLHDLIWAQEEPKNNGAWTFVEPLIEACLAEAGFATCGRNMPAATPARRPRPASPSAMRPSRRP